MIRIVFLAAALAITSIVQTRAHTVVCYPADRLFEALRDLYGETPTGAGISAGGKSIVQAWVSEEGTWTIIDARADGLSCILAHGENWSTGSTDTEKKS